LGLELGAPVENVAPLRQADVLLHCLDSKSPPAVDFSVVHPLQLSHYLAEVHAGILAKAVERYKTREQFAVCRARIPRIDFSGDAVGESEDLARHLFGDVGCSTDITDSVGRTIVREFY